MLLSLKELAGFSIQAQDGEIGKVNDFYFDDQEWVVRHLIDKTGFGLLGRQTLIAPDVIEMIDLDEKRLTISLIREQVENSPSRDEAKPLARDIAKKVADDNLFRRQVSGDQSGDETSFAIELSAQPKIIPIKREMRQHLVSDGPNLHSSNDVMGYQISTNNGQLGHIVDMIIDDETWAIQYLVVGSKKELDNKRILIAPEHIDWISWKQKSVSVSLDKEKIQECPNFNLTMPILNDRRDLLYEQFECVHLWDQA